MFSIKLSLDTQKHQLQNKPITESKEFKAKLNWVWFYCDKIIEIFNALIKGTPLRVETNIP